VAAATRTLAIVAVLCAARFAYAQVPDDAEPEPPAATEPEAPAPPPPMADATDGSAAGSATAEPTVDEADRRYRMYRANLDDLPEMPLTDQQIIGSPTHWKIEDVEVRTSYLSQYGHGYQSQDGTPRGTAGSEAMNIIEPWTLFHLRQNDHIVHEVMIPVDVLTHASPNVGYWFYQNPDAITSASRHNVSGDIDVRTTITESPVDTVTTHVKFHAEEPLASGLVGGGYTRHLADDNATLGVSGSFTIDGFDLHDVAGDYLGKSTRETGNVNLTASQLLSPTTVVDGIYALTLQAGQLDADNGWEAVPLTNGSITSEVFPHERTRQAFAARIAQNIPWTGTTLKASYRYYTDSFDVHAHTVEVDAYQYIVPWLYVRGSYRFHTQTAVDFFTTRLMFPIVAPYYTADSDLAAFDANEWTAQVVIVRDRAPSWLKRWRLTAEVMEYWRTNDLRITMVSLSAGKSLL
jgi:hypothetical protein